MGLEVPAPELPGDWEARLLEALAADGAPGEGTGVANAVRRRSFGEHAVECVQLGEACLVITSAPLLPKQLSHCVKLARVRWSWLSHGQQAGADYRGCAALGERPVAAQAERPVRPRRGVDPMTPRYPGG